MASTEILLPPTKTELAERLKADLPRLEPFIQAVDDQKVFFPAFIAAVNGMKPNTDYQSILVSCMNAAVVGLVPGAARQHCYIIPYWNTRADRHIAQLIMGYKGWIELGYRSKHLDVIHPPGLVKYSEIKEERFRIWNDEEGNHFRHDPDPADPEPHDRDNVAGAYLAWKTRGGSSSYIWVPRVQIDKVDSGKNVWESDFAAMCMKVPVARAAKVWQTTSSLDAAARVDETDNAATDDIQRAASAVIMTSSVEAQSGRLIALFESKMKQFGEPKEWLALCQQLLAEHDAVEENLKDQQFCQRVLDELKRRSPDREDLRRQAGLDE